MKKILVLLIAISIQLSTQARDAIFTLNIVNESDGTVQVLPDSIAMDAFKSISTQNPLSDVIMDQIRQFTQDKLQAAIETASQIQFQSGTSGILTLDFCPLSLKIKKLSGVDSGKEMVYRVSTCKTATIVVTKVDGGLSVTLQQ